MPVRGGGLISGPSYAWCPLSSPATGRWCVVTVADAESRALTARCSIFVHEGYLRHNAELRPEDDLARSSALCQRRVALVDKIEHLAVRALDSASATVTTHHRPVAGGRQWAPSV